MLIVYKRTLVSGTPLNLINTYHLVRAHAIVCTYLGFALPNGIKVILKLNLKFSYQSDIHLMRTNKTKWFKSAVKLQKEWQSEQNSDQFKKNESCMNGVATCYGEIQKIRKHIYFPTYTYFGFWKNYVMQNSGLY